MVGKTEKEQKEQLICYGRGGMGALLLFLLFSIITLLTEQNKVFLQFICYRSVHEFNIPLPL